MSRTINRVELLGRVGTDPEMRYSQGGTAVTTMRLATDCRRQNGDTEADWHSVVCWGKQAEAVAEYVQKGNRVFVAGSIAQNSYETEDGQRRHRTEVHAQEVVFLDSNGSGNGRSGEREQEPEAELSEVLLRYASQFEADSYAHDASSVGGVVAWCVEPNDAVEHVDVLVERV